MRSRLRLAAAIGCAWALSGCSSYSKLMSYAPEEAPAEGIMQELALAPQGEDGAAVRKAAATGKAVEEPGFGMDQTARNHEGRPVRDDDIARVLANRLRFRTGAQVAAIEAQARREWVEVPTWGQARTQVEGVGWTARPAAPEVLKSLREGLGLASAACPAPAGEPPSPIGDVGTVPSLFLPIKADLARVRYAAARVGSDVVLVFARSTRIHEYRNRFANLYPTLVGLALPGESVLVIARCEGALVDARTGVVYAVAQGGARGEDERSPLTSSKEYARRLMEEIEIAAIGDMARALRERLAHEPAEPADAPPRPAAKPGERG